MKNSISMRASGHVGNDTLAKTVRIRAPHQGAFFCPCQHPTTGLTVVERRVVSLTGSHRSLGNRDTSQDGLASEH